MFRRSSPGGGTSWTSRQLQCLVEFIRMQCWGEICHLQLTCFFSVNTALSVTNQRHTADTHAHTHTHRDHFTTLWILSGITRVSQYQNQSGFYWSKRHWVAVASAGPYANRPRWITMLAPHQPVFYGPDALPAAQPTLSKHWRHVCLLT